MTMKPMLLFVYLVVISAISFLFAFAGRAAPGKDLPIKNASLRRTLFIVAGSVFLLCALLALYAAIAKTH
jgi:hypothetical protein